MMRNSDGQNASFYRTSGCEKSRIQHYRFEIIRYNFRLRLIIPFICFVMKRNTSTIYHDLFSLKRIQKPKIEILKSAPGQATLVDLRIFKSIMYLCVFEIYF